jgi:hypothetical protein
MSSENPEIRHPSIPDSGDAEHRNMPGLILLLLLAKKKKYRRRTSHEDYFDKDGIIKKTRYKSQDRRVVAEVMGQDADRR